MSTLPDFAQLKLVISKYWSAEFPASALGNEAIKLYTAQAEEQVCATVVHRHPRGW